MTMVGTIIGVLVIVAVALGLWWLWHTRLQLCPHCGWIVPRVERGWLRCSRCHKQYARQARRRPR